MASVTQLQWHLNLDQGTTIVTVRDTVVWTWTDEAPHSVQSIGTPSFSSSLVKTGIGSQHSFHFTEIGEYSYNCAVHGDTMKGIISVRGTITAPSIMPTTELVTTHPTAGPTTKTLAPSPMTTMQPTSNPTNTETKKPSNEPSSLPSSEPSLISTTIAPSMNPTRVRVPEQVSINWGTSNSRYDKVVITAGDTVQWVWIDSAPHDVRSIDDQFMTSPIMTGAGNIYEITFYTPGTYPFDCSIHPQLMKVVVVVNAEESSDSNEAPRKGCQEAIRFCYRRFL